MIDTDKILAFLSDLESDRVERTVSTNNTDKFGQAICAFANDLPGHSLPGYLIIGANDDGSLCGLRVTDELLKNIAGIKYDGNIQPQPSMTVEKVVIDGQELIVVEVQPAQLPPVKYKGRIWVRVGPRKGYASEGDERLLYEKRAAGIKTHDAMPCIGATLADLDQEAIEAYLRRAWPADIREADHRDIRLKLQALGFYDMRFDVPTYAGLIMFCPWVERFLPGAYIQYVRFAGATRASDIASEYKFSGHLMKILSQLDTFVDSAITNRRPVPVSALREEAVADYPHWATRELLMNAICHRDYQSNGPIQFYQYSDRIEIMNHGALYGRATPENFPNVNDYRNPVLAEAMKVTGFVNRLSRGVQRVEEELRDNGNGHPIFSLHLGTAFLVTEPISLTAQSKETEGIKYIKTTHNAHPKTANKTTNKEPMTQPITLTARQRGLLSAFISEPTISLLGAAAKLGLTRAAARHQLQRLPDGVTVHHTGSNKGGRWVVMVADGYHIAKQND